MVFRHSSRSGRCLGVLLLLVVASSCCIIGASSIGVNYGTVANDLPSPAQVVSLIQTTYISQVKIYDANPDIISAFANTGISLVVGARNDEISSLAASESFAQQWVSQNVASYYPSTNIVCIVVGNEVISTAPNSTNDLVPAMQNLYTGLTNLGLSDIKVSTPHSFEVFDTSYPPSDGIFRADLSGPIFTPMLNFLAQTGGPFMVNVYPYFAYRDDPKISISYALFQPNSDVVDSVTGLSYNNLFDAQVDAAYAAMAKLGHQDITVTVSETGWPSFGDADEVGVSMTNAQTYISNLLQHVNSQGGTPNRPGAAPDTYIFSLFNENQKPGPSSERNFGLFLPDQSVVYNVGLVTTTTNTSSPPPVVSTNPPPVGSPPPLAPAPTSTPEPPPPSSLPPPFTTATPPPSTTATPPPPYTAPPPPYPVPHVPPAAGSIPSPPVASTYPPPASSSPPPASSSPPPSTATPPPPPSFFTPPPGSSSPPPASGTPPYLPSPPPPPSAASPPPATTSPPPASPPPSTPAPESPPPSVSASPPPSPSPPAPESPPPSPPVPESPPPSPPTPAAPTPGFPPPSSPTPTVPPPATGAPPGTPPAPPGTASGPNTWCVAKPGSPTDDLANALNYACGEGGADCSQIQSGASCFNPDTLFSHASFAFSSYYAKNGRNYWNCFFGNSSLITITNPSYAGCTFP